MDDQGKLVLETPRLLFRRFTEADAPLLNALHSDPEVMRYISKGVPQSLAEIEEKVLPRWLAYHDEYEHFGFWAAHERATKAFIGWFHLRPFRGDPDEIEVGYRLHRRFWGQGYATEGSRALIEKAFTDWGVEKIVATTLAENAASRRVMEKCGLAYEGPFVYPSKLLPDWTVEERRGVKYGLQRMKASG